MNSFLTLISCKKGSYLSSILELRYNLKLLLFWYSLVLIFYCYSIFFLSEAFHADFSSFSITPLYFIAKTYVAKLRTTLVLFLFLMHISLENWHQLLCDCHIIPEQYNGTVSYFCISTKSLLSFPAFVFLCVFSVWSYFLFFGVCFNNITRAAELVWDSLTGYQSVHTLGI